MNGGTTFDWRTLGKADYSQAAALVASLPEESRRCLDGTDKELMTRILHLSWMFSARSGKGNGYCWPTLATLAKWCNRSCRTIQRHLTRLHNLGLISWRNRVRADGTHTSNLYQMGKTFIATLFARKNKKTSIKPTTTKMSDKDLKRDYKASAPIQTGERLTDFLARHRANNLGRLGAAQVDSAADDWGQEETVVDRKTLLKRQAEQLLAAEAHGEW